VFIGLNFCVYLMFMYPWISIAMGSSWYIVPPFDLKY
jgi:hypothetical protein